MRPNDFRQNTFLKLVALCLVVLFLSACAKEKKSLKPDWVASAKPAGYPAIRYMIGVGAGDSLEAAGDRARAEIAKQFKVKIEGSLVSVEEAIGIRSGKGALFAGRTMVTDVVRSTTSATIEGVAIKEKYQDPQTKRWYALAALDRIQTLSRLEFAINEKDEQIATLLQQSQMADNKLAKLRPLLSAVDAVSARHALNSQLMIVDPAAEGKRSVITPQLLGQKIREILGEISVAISLEGDDEAAKKIRASLIESVTRASMRFSEERETADILVSGRVSIAQTNEVSNSEYLFQRIETSLELMNQTTGKSFGMIEFNKRLGALTLADAKRTVIAKAKEEILARFANAMREFFTK